MSGEPSNATNERTDDLGASGSQRLHTLVMCDCCGRGYPVGDMRPSDGWLVCPECDAAEDEPMHDCDTAYRHDCARGNGVSPEEAGTW